MSGDATALNLSQIVTPPTETFFPGLLEGDLLLSYESVASSTAASGISSGSGSGGGGDGAGSEEGLLYGSGEGGVVWSVDATVSNAAMMTWTVFPSTGLLLPGEK